MTKEDLISWAQSIPDGKDIDFIICDHSDNFDADHVTTLEYNGSYELILGLDEEFTIIREEVDDVCQ